MQLKGKKILVVGYGVSGESVVRFLLDQKAQVCVYDREEKSIPQNILKSIQTFWGALTEELTTQCDVIVISPGVPTNHPAIEAAQKKKIPVLGEFGLACLFLKTPMIAVTGTNGKSTVVTLLFEIFKKDGFRVDLAGNIGKPLIDVVREGKKLDWVVVEVSSYQLETVQEFHPKISIILNITEDHLDRYPSIQEYAQAKFRIFSEQKSSDTFIYNQEDVLTKKAANKVKCKKVIFSAFKTKGVDVWTDGLCIYWKKEKYPLAKVTLKGVHNIENMMSCIVAGRVGGCSQKNIQKVLEDFAGLPHRVQFVRTVDGVGYYDDSKATNVDAVVRALEGFGDGKVVLIAGGRDKEGSYEPLARMSRKKVKVVILIGEAKEKMANALFGYTTVLKRDNLSEAISLARQRSVAGDIVLLSPACSSFDQFKDYKDRGDTFKKLVRALPV